MGFFSRFSKKVEQVNKGEASIEELSDELYLDKTKIPQDEAMDTWVSMAQTILINAVKATDNSIERVFVLINFNPSSPSFDIFYQDKEKLLYWEELENEEYKSKLKNQLLPQAKEVTDYINSQFEKASLTKIGYAELQFESATLAWFSHIIYSDSEDTKLDKDNILSNWFECIKETAKSLPLDSDTKLPWYPN